MVDSIRSLYPRLHFYLPTKLQMVPIDEIFLVELDGRTNFTETYFFTEWKPVENANKQSVVTRSNTRRMETGGKR